MKKSFWKIAPYAVIAGFIITLLLMSQMKRVDYRTCAQYDPVYNNIKRVDCSSLEHGYPLKFIRSEPFVDVSTLGPSKTSPIFLGASSAVRFRLWNFAADVALWSVISLAILVAVADSYEHRKKN